MAVLIASKAPLLAHVQLVLLVLLLLSLRSCSKVVYSKRTSIRSRLGMPTSSYSSVIASNKDHDDDHATPANSLIAPNEADDAATLLIIKASLTDPTNSLSSWNKHSIASLCTSWLGVTCSNHNTTNSSIIITGIDLSGKNLSGPLPPSVGSLSSLQALNMSNNVLSGSLPPELMACMSLRSLDLSNNNLSGEIPIGLSKLGNMETLNLGSNYFVGPIPHDIVLCPSLKHLDLGGSYLEGPIPPYVGNLTSLVSLTLAGNLLSGPIPPSIKHLHKLQWLYLGYNQLTGAIPQEIAELTNLHHLDLVHNNLSGELPSSLFSNLTSLQFLFLFDNMLSGMIPPVIGNLTQLISLDLSSNMLSGAIPLGIANLQQLQVLNLFSNNLTGAIPDSIAGMHSLQVLALWMNQLSGEVPSKLGLKNKLTELDLSSNHLTGPIPDGLCASGMLHKLILFSNSMSGGIPDGLANCQSLQRVRLQNNMLSGSLPSSFINLPLVYYLDISFNNFSGRLDAFGWNMSSLQVLLLKANKFTGNIPPSIAKSKGLINLDLSHNALLGNIPPDFGSLGQLTELYLQSNALSGVIPSQLMRCHKLVDLDLSNNQLSGSIPAELADLQVLSSLDLSQNRLAGTIPPQLGAMESLVLINVSYNNLSGQVPLSGAFIQINTTCIEGNQGLCGGGSLEPCSSTEVSSQHARYSPRLVSRVTQVLLVLGLLTVMVGFYNVYSKVKQGEWGSKALIKLRQLKGDPISFINIKGTAKLPKEWELVLFQSTIKPTVDDVLKAMQGENVVEKRSYSTVYKGSTKKGVPFAAMEMIGTACDDDKEGASLATSAIGKVRHANMLNVYGICKGAASSILVFEHVEGSCRLSSLIHGFQGAALVWSKRLDIAIGISKALVHLHCVSSPPLVHGSLCSDNVIVGHGHVARLMPATSMRAVDPKDECDGRREADMRGLGVVLLELVTGKRPAEVAEDVLEWARTRREELRATGSCRLEVDRALARGLDEDQLAELAQEAEVAVRLALRLMACGTLGQSPSPTWTAPQALARVQDLRRRRQERHVRHA